MNIFKEMISCLSFKNYRLFRSDRAGKNFLYMLVMSIICFVLTIGVGLCVPFAALGGFSGIAENIPDFSMTPDGVLSIDYQLDTVSTENDRVIIDTNYNYAYDEETDTVFRNNNGVREDIINVNEYARVMVIGANAMVVIDDKTTGEGTTTLEYKQIPVEYLSKINVDFLIEICKKAAVGFLICAFVFVFIRLAIWNMVNSAVGACISSSMGVKNTFGQLYAMGLRAYTPVYLVCCVLSAFHINVPFKTIVALLITGLILSKGIKTIKKQLEEDEMPLSVEDSDMAFRTMYGEGNENSVNNNNIE